MTLNDIIAPGTQPEIWAKVTVLPKVRPPTRMETSSFPTVRTTRSTVGSQAGRLPFSRTTAPTLLA